MCMIYNGIAYPYAFEFNSVSVRDEPRIFRIIISDYREITEDFTGLCFENSLSVTSGIRFEKGAFFEIVSKIVRFTEEGENMYMARFNKLPPQASVEDNIIRQFEIKKKSQKSLDYYKDLRKHFENPEFFEEADYMQSMAVEEQLATRDCIFLLPLAVQIDKRAPKLKRFIYFRT